ncbi:MAG: polysaccharide deacetylase family protein [Solirubrobacteraceae bacterium]
MTRRTAIAVAAAAAVAATAAGTAGATSFAAREGRVAGCKSNGDTIAFHGPRGRRVVALTFDDGPSQYTATVLSILRRAKVKATFFVLGSQISTFPNTMKAELAEGHAIGNHTWNHPSVAGGGGFAFSQLRGTSRRIRSATGYTPCVFRPPYGAFSGGLIRIARGLGMNTVNWDVDPRDWSRPGQGAIYSRIVNAVRPGSIVLMHDGGGPRGQTVGALPGIIANLKRRGYRFETVPQLLGLKPVIYYRS